MKIQLTHQRILEWILQRMLRRSVEGGWKSAGLLLDSMVSVKLRGWFTVWSCMLVFILDEGLLSFYWTMLCRVEIKSCGFYLTFYIWDPLTRSHVYFLLSWLGLILVGLTVQSRKVSNRWYPRSCHRPWRMLRRILVTGHKMSFSRHCTYLVSGLCRVALNYQAHYLKVRIYGWGGYVV